MPSLFLSRPTCHTVLMAHISLQPLVLIHVYFNITTFLAIIACARHSLVLRQTQVVVQAGLHLADDPSQQVFDHQVFGDAHGLGHLVQSVESVSLDGILDRVPVNVTMSIGNLSSQLPTHMQPMCLVSYSRKAWSRSTRNRSISAVASSLACFNRRAFFLRAS